MPVPAVDADKRGDAYKKVKPVEGIDEQGLVPDPQVMHVLFARLMAALTQRVRAQPVGPVPSCVRLRVVVKFGALPPASEQPPVPGESCCCSAYASGSWMRKTLRNASC